MEKKYLIQEKYFSVPNIDDLLIIINKWIFTHPVEIDHIVIDREPYSNYHAKLYFKTTEIKNDTWLMTRDK